MTASSPDSVLFEQVDCSNGKQIALATLNRPQTLNGLSLELTRLLDEKLNQWVADPQIALVILRGTGEKAFCAGGDLHSLFHDMQAHAGQPAR